MNFGQFFQAIIIGLKSRMGEFNAAQYVGERAELVQAIFLNWQNVNSSRSPDIPGEVLVTIEEIFEEFVKNSGQIIKLNEKNWPEDIHKIPESHDVNIRDFIMGAVSAVVNEVIPPRCQKYEFDRIVSRYGRIVQLGEKLFQLTFQPFRCSTKDGRLKLRYLGEQRNAA